MLHVTEEWAQAVIVAQAIILMASVSVSVALLLFLRAIANEQHRLCAKLGVEPADDRVHVYYLFPNWPFKSPFKSLWGRK